MRKSYIFLHIFRFFLLVALKSEIRVLLFVFFESVIVFVFVFWDLGREVSLFAFVFLDLGIKVFVFVFVLLKTQTKVFVFVFQL